MYVSALDCTPALIVLLIYSLGVLHSLLDPPYAVSTPFHSCSMVGFGSRFCFKFFLLTLLLLLILFS